jgi:hypothetical protein
MTPVSTFLPSQFFCRMTVAVRECECQSTLLESKNTHGHNNGFLVVSFCAHDLALSLQSRWQGFSVAFINFLQNERRLMASVTGDF